MFCSIIFYVLNTCWHLHALLPYAVYKFDLKFVLTESEVYENGSVSENAEAFEAHILKTMKGIAENAESIPGVS